MQKRMWSEFDIIKTFNNFCVQLLRNFTANHCRRHKFSLRIRFRVKYEPALKLIISIKATSQI